MQDRPVRVDEGVPRCGCDCGWCREQRLRVLELRLRFQPRLMDGALRAELMVLRACVRGEEE